MKKILFSLLMMFSFLNITFALNNYELIKNTTQGTDCFQSNNKIIKTSDGNILTVGYYSSSTFGLTNSGLADAAISKYDEYGNVLWHKNYSSSSLEIFTSVTEINGYYYATGYKNTTNQPANLKTFIVKYDNKGTVVWEKEYEIDNYQYSMPEDITTDGENIAIIGKIVEDSTPKAYVITMNKDGEIVKEYISTLAKEYNTITYDGTNYIVGGISTQNNKTIIASLTKELKVNTEKELTYTNKITKIIYSNENYYAVGNSENNSFIIKFDDKGEILKSVELSNEGQLALVDIIEQKNTYYVIGYTNNGNFSSFKINNINTYDYIVLEYDNNLNYVSSKNFGTEKNEIVLSCVFSNNRIYFAGYVENTTVCTNPNLCPSNWITTIPSMANANLNSTQSNGNIATLDIYGTYNIYVKITGNGKIGVANKSKAGEAIKFNITPTEGNALNKVIVKDKDNKEIAYTANTFTMPTSDVTIEVVFGKKVENPETSDNAIIACVAIIILGAIGTIYSFKKLSWLK